MTHCIVGAATTKSSIAVLVWWKWTNAKQKYSLIQPNFVIICSLHIKVNTHLFVSRRYDTIPEVIFKSECSKYEKN